jgi:predicted O-linked N-acetylglucosamine transferase (SPINDLY family)
MTACTESVAVAFGVALQAHQAGDLTAAIAGYRSVLATDGGHAGARVNLAAALRSAGRLEEALEAYGVAVETAGAMPELWFNYGNTLRDLGRAAEAEAAYRRAIALRADLPGAHFHLADLLHAAGRTEEALGHWQATLELEPHHAPAWRRVVRAALAAGQTAEALRRLEIAVQRAPHDAWLLARLADLRRDGGDLEAAAELLRRAVAADPVSAIAHDSLGIVLASSGDLDGAQAAFERALSLAPNHAGIASNLATLHARRNRLQLAIPLYRRALELDPDVAEAGTGLVKSLARGGACQEAVAVAEAAVARRPGDAEGWQALGFALTLQGRIAEALAAFAEARRLDPEHVLAHLNAAFTSLYSDALSAEEVTALHRELAGTVERSQPARSRPAPRDPDPDRQLRVGYLGQDFRGHPVGYFLESALVHHDPGAVEVLCYADVANPDAVTERMRALGLRGDLAWRDVYGWSADRLAEQIRSDGVDLLVELGGHTAAHTALLLPRRPAPIQALYLGYPCTSGVSAVDYLIGDEIVSPPELAALYSESVMALDGCFLCYRPYPDAPPVGPPPVLAGGSVTFGCYNNLPKLSPRALALWARVLDAVPGSQLVVKAPGLDDPPTRERLSRQLVAQGIARQRVTLLGITSPLSRFLAEYDRIDVALDSLPYTGGTTTCEALWMGVPVVTLAGRHFLERMGASVLAHAGLPELVAGNADEFVRIAVELARDVPGLARLRADLRDRLRASRLCDGPAYARALESAYRRMWRATLARPAGD